MVVYSKPGRVIGAALGSKLIKRSVSPTLQGLLVKLRNNPACLAWTSPTHRMKIDANFLVFLTISPSFCIGDLMSLDPSHWPPPVPRR